MNGLLKKFRKRNIQANLPHFLLVIFVVAVSVCLITGLFISHLTLSNSIQEFYSNSNLPRLWIQTDKITSQDEEFLSQFEYAKRYSFDSDFTIGTHKYNSQFLVADGEVSRPYLIEGAKGNGCYVDAKFVEKYKIGVNNSKIKLEFSINNETRTLSFIVLGSLAMAEDLLVDDECVIFIDEEIFINELKSSFAGQENVEIDYNQVLITSSLSVSDESNIREYYADRTGPQSEIKAQNDIASFKAVAREIEVSRAMLVVFPSLFVIVSILVVISAVSELISKERYNFGLLKSIGIRNQKILSNYCGYGVYMCLIGAILGMIIAPLIVPNVSFETYDMLFNLPRDEVQMLIPYWLIIAIIFSVILIGYFSAFVVCIKFTLRTPKECMQGVRKIKLNKRKNKKRGGKLTSALKNMKDNPARTIMSLFAIAGCSILILLGYGVELLDKTRENIQNVKSFQMFSTLFKGFAVVILMLTTIVVVMQILKEKSREIAMQRIHGESYVKVWLNLMIEMLVLSVLGFAIAGILAQPIFMLMLKFFNIYTMIFIDFFGFLKTFLIVFGFILISSIIAIIRIYKTDMVDATKFSE